MNKKYIAAIAASCAVLFSLVPLDFAAAAYRFGDFQGRPPIHVYRASAGLPAGLTPYQVKKAYQLPATGGQGTIALIEAYDDPTLEADLGVFSKTFGLSACTVKNGCLEKRMLASSTAKNSGWALETSLDVEWAHAIAPQAKILVVEAKTPSGANLLSAIDYAVKRSGVVAVSMSWGGAEFSDEKTLDSHFSSSSKIVFFASSGDDGAGVSWPAASPLVVSVGGTSLMVGSSTGKLISEKAWSGSGGGVSAYEAEPDYQKAYSIAKAKGMRAVPDVAYNADPKTGYPVYKAKTWYVIGGTSAGAPQWAAIQSLGLSTQLAKLYADKAASSSSAFFRDIVSGSNGDCKYYCVARKHYDYVTGLGVPQTIKF